ncbi:PCC domain-containing protein [Dactylosporangium sp. McL0621]|uniref:PCC domain-containing protein n=1 Tax=Dactylosporangium sp. McL0621 TaxID=3415678 RepID=UPI003CEDA107
MFIVRVGHGEEVLETIMRQVAARDVTDAAVTLIGAVQECTVGCRLHEMAQRPGAVQHEVMEVSWPTAPK